MKHQTAPSFRGSALLEVIAGFSLLLLVIAGIFHSQAVFSKISHRIQESAQRHSALNSVHRQLRPALVRLPPGSYTLPPSVAGTPVLITCSSETPSLSYSPLSAKRCSILLPELPPAQPDSSAAVVRLAGDR